MERYGTWHGIPIACFGVRKTSNYEEPFAFNIAVNNMSDVMSHKDAELPRGHSYDIQSSAGVWGYRTVTTGKSKRL